MNCLSRRALLRWAGAAGAVALAVLAVYLSPGASAAVADPAPGLSVLPESSPATPTTPPALRKPTPPGPTSAAPLTAGVKAGVTAGVTGDEPSIVFSGSAMAPLVCSSTPSASELTISADTRITLANLTGVEATVDTGTPGEATTITVADGLGVSVRFRPGRYALRMVPDCTMIKAVDSATLIVAADEQPAPSPTGHPDLATATPDPTPTAHTLEGTEPAGNPIHPGTPTTTAPVPPAIPATAQPPATAQVALGSSAGASPTRASPSHAALGTRTPTTRPASPPGTVALPAGPESVIYDIQLVPVQQPGDPRDSRLLALLAVICVFGVTTAIIRAILTQRARGTVSP